MSKARFLQNHGWGPQLEESFPPYRQQGLHPGRVSFAHREHYRLLAAHGELRASLKGRLRHGSDLAESLPVVGDWVAYQELDNSQGLIHAVLPRLTQLSRKVPGERAQPQVVAANVDTVFLVMGLDGDYNPRRLERLLSMAWESGATPVVVLNKADLRHDAVACRGEIADLALGSPVYLISCHLEQGLLQLSGELSAGRTVALLGSSGVGKSTLINRLLGDDLLRTSAVREGDDRGRHTTTHRQLLRLPGGALLIDNPGIREIQLWHSETGRKNAFSDIEDLAEHCRYRDCQHQDEPGCAVREAIARGSLASERLTNHHALEREARYLELRSDDFARRQESRKIAAIHKAAKKHKPRW